MFVGTQNSISVYDLLTLQLVWTQSGTHIFCMLMYTLMYSSLFCRCVVYVVDKSLFAYTWHILECTPDATN